jgi:glyoxylase I family protein
MTSLDHLIVPARDPEASAAFYQRVLGFTREARVGPFEVVRVNPTLTLDLLRQAPRDRAHLAFQLTREEFDEAYRRLRDADIDYGGGPFDRSRHGPGRTQGAQGMAESLYFDDPDGHNIEIRCYAAAG